MKRYYIFVCCGSIKSGTEIYTYLWYMQFMYLEEQGRTVDLESYLSILLFERRACILRSECTFKFLSGKDKGTIIFIFSQWAFSHWKVSVAMYPLKCSLSATIFILKTFGKTYKQLTFSSSLFLNIFFFKLMVFQVERNLYLQWY